MKIIKHIIVLSIGVFATSCFNLDQSPYETFGEKSAFKNPTDAKAWVDGVYSRMREFVYNESMVLPEVQTDGLNFTDFAEFSLQNIHRWDTFSTNEEMTQKVWKDAYRALADINKALIGFDAIPEQDAIKYNRGELHLARAYYYTTLVTLFCKAYDPITATSDLGLPLVLTDDFTLLTKRSTLKETYEHILSDLQKAENLLVGKQDVDKITFTSDSVKALRARVLLYMQRWNEAYQEANNLISSGKYPLVSISDFEAIWYSDDNSESITQLFASNIKEEQAESQLVRNYLMRFESPGFPDSYTPGLLPTKTFIDLYDASDIRKAVYFTEQELFDASTGNLEMVYLVNKFPGNPALKYTSDASYAHSPKIFRIGEVYTIAFEASFQNNDEANALRLLNELKEARGLNAVSFSGNALYQEIKNERTRELAFEGFRLVDLKRWKEDVVRGVPQNENLIITTPASQYHELNRSATDYKLIWPIPTGDVSQIVKQNSGW